MQSEQIPTREDREPQTFNRLQVVTLKGYLFDAWPMPDGAWLLYMRNQTDPVPFEVGERFEYMIWGEWEVEAIYDAKQPRFVQVRQLSTPGGPDA